MKVHVITDSELGRDGGRDPRRRLLQPQRRHFADREPDAGLS
jgi:hypothetical protein